MSNFPNTAADTKTDEGTTSTPVPASDDENLATDSNDWQGEEDVENENEVEEDGEDEGEEIELAKIEIRLPSVFLLNTSP
jgi:hypothetical protein